MKNLTCGLLLLCEGVTSAKQCDSGEAVNLELWSGMLLMSEHASSSSYERPLEQDGMLTATPRTTNSPLFFSCISTTSVGIRVHLGFKIH